MPTTLTIARSTLLPALIAATVVSGCASVDRSTGAYPRPGGIVASYEHEGAEGAGEVYIDPGPGQYGYPHAGASVHVGTAAGRFGVADSDVYGIYGPGLAYTGSPLFWHRPVVFRPRPVVVVPQPPRNPPAASPVIRPTPPAIDRRHSRAGNPVYAPRQERTRQDRGHSRADR